MEEHGMVTFEKIASKKAMVAVIGLGYVGLPLAAALGRYVNVIGFETCKDRIDQLRQGIDTTGELSREALASTQAEFTEDAQRLKDASFLIVTVPTPVNDHNKPDLNPVRAASHLIARNLSPGSIVVYESTVYPGVTEEICLPILERKSGLKNGVDFKVGYSPERINPGDREHTVENIVKVVSGQDEETLETVARVYEMVVKAGVHRASSIKVAEAAKVIENTQRDLNIALMNELAILFNKMAISTRDVLAAAGTKWNFLRFFPGLVGGHCIGVDPYYLTYRAEEMGYIPQVILAGRRINDNMGKYIAEMTVKKLIQVDKAVKGARVLVLGLTFKENVRDIRNSKVVDIVRELQEYEVEALVCDPLASVEQTRARLGIELVDFDHVGKVDGVIMAVAHDLFNHISPGRLRALCSNGNGQGVVVDVKSALEKDAIEREGLRYWAL
jgi:UDP-N-acetyl-D-galactosamine dehydrogenase